MATKMLCASALVSAACWMGLSCAGDLAAAPRTNRRPTTSRPAPKPAAKPVAKPQASKPPAVTGPTNASSASEPMPVPPQPMREGLGAGSSSLKIKSAEPAIVHPEESKSTSKSTEMKSVEAKPGTPAVPQPRTTTLFDAPPIEVKADADGKYLFRYHFSGGETIRWDVTHEAKFVTTVQSGDGSGSGNTQTADTTTKSVKTWKVVATQPGGEATFVHLIESLEMRQKLTGRQETHYNSRTDKDIPPMFADAAKQVGMPMAEVTIDTRGHVLKRVDRLKRPDGAPVSTITMILPDKPLAIGESWTVPFDLPATDGKGNPKQLKARHKLTLESVNDHLAVLKNETQILSPLDDPALQAAVVQSETSGTVTFDLRRGRIVSQKSSLDKEIFGFQGPESKLHYTAQFDEHLSDDTKTAEETRPSDDDKTATKPTVGTKK